MMASALSSVPLEHIALEPVDEEIPPAKENKKAPQATAQPAIPQTSPTRPRGKAEVSPLLKKLAQQAALQDEIEEEPTYIIDSRSAVIEQWRRQQFWANFPWRPVLFVFGLLAAVTLLAVAAYALWPMMISQFRE